MTEKARHKSFFGNSPRGFTLIEALVVISIIGIISAIVLVDSRKGNESLALDRAAHTVAQDLRATNERALKGEVFTCTTGAITGYGVYFDSSTPTSYIVFADCNGDDVYNANDEVVQHRDLDRKIQIASLTPSDPLHIMFIPPDPTVAFGGGPSAQIVLAPAGTISAPTFTYVLQADVFQWQNPRALPPKCDADPCAQECGASFPAGPADPSVIYDQYRIGGSPSCSGQKRSSEFVKTSTAGAMGDSRQVNINARGAIDID